MRSLLCVDPLEADRLVAKTGAETDALVIAADGGTARVEAAAALLENLQQRGDAPLRFVRLSLRSAIGDALDRLIPFKPHGVVLADGFAPAAVQALGVKLAVREAKFGLAEGTVSILAEAGADAGGLLSLAAFGGCSARLFGVTWHADALAGSCGAMPDAFAGGRAEPSTISRTLMALGAAAAGVAAYDTPSTAMGEALAQECRAARRLGFVGKIATDPAQVPIINAAFAQDA